MAARKKKPPACAEGSFSNSRVAACRLAWRLAPPVALLVEKDAVNRQRYFVIATIML
jgi:hypothetical protein